MKESGRVLEWCDRWLPVIMGCHCRPDRSFSWKGRPFPVCARCTGMLVGFLLALCLWPIRELPWVWAGALLPGILDGAVQLRTAYESNNRRRLWTGILLGWGSMSLLVESFVWVWRLGWQTGLALKSAEVFCKIVKI